VLVGTLVGQASPGVLEDPVYKEQFMESARQKYGGWAWVLYALGAFRVFSSLAFIIVVTVLGLSIAACTAHRVPHLWRAWRHPKVTARTGFFDEARLRTTIPTDLPPDQAKDRVAGLLRAKRYRVIAPAPNHAPQLYADRSAWAGVGTVLAHASFIGILLAFVLSANGGMDQMVNLAVGADPVAVPGTDWELVADEFNASFTDTGMPLDYVSHLVLSQDGTVLASQDVRVNEPLRRDGIKFHQYSYGVAALVEVADSSGQMIFVGPVPLEYQSDDGSRAIGLAELPGTGTDIQVAVAASGQTAAELSGLEPGQASISIFPVDSTTATGQALADQGEPTKVGGFTVTFVRETQYTGILARSDPGAGLMWAASVLLIIGMTITLTVHHRRLRVLVEPAESGAVVRLASNDRAGVGLDAPFTSIAGKIRHELTT
jgi:cytochrome c biogenesis protein